MKAKELRGKEICRNFCIYYKPGKNEDIACLGSRVVEALTARRGDLALAGSAGKATAVKGVLVEALCKRCPFHSEDCDYILSHGDARPCGGLMTLSGLLGEHVITIDEVRNVLDRLF